MKLLIFHFALLFVLVIANPISPVEDPIEEPVEELNEQPADEIEDEPSNIGSEYGDKFQGDMILPPDDDGDDNTEDRSGRTGIKNTNYRWPKTSGYVRVPYLFGSGFTTAEKNIITKAMGEIQSKTCVRFSTRTTQTNYIRIINSSGCWSYLGKIGGRQDLSLQRNGCVYHGIVMHELIHALGYGHQHSHYQRDQKISIQWSNIIESEKSNFDILSSKNYDNYGTAFDINSVMHYDDYAFSKNGKRTIVAKNSADQNRMGQRTALSAGDITRIKKMYGC